MTDIKTLKALAEAAGAQDREIQESDYGDEHWFGGDGCGQIEVGGWVGGGCKKNQGEWQQLKADAKFIAAANPALVLDLIAQIDYLALELTGVERVKGELAEKLDCAHEPRWKWMLIGADNLLEERDRLKAENDSLHAKIDRLLAHCQDGECATCGEIICPHGGAMHFHHDGCPSCAEISADMSKE